MKAALQLPSPEESKGINGLSTLFHILLFDLECEMPLCEIAKAHNNDGCQGFSYGWIEVEPLYEKLDKNIVQQHTYHHKCKIPCKLHSSPQCGSRKYNISHQIKTGRESYHERDHK